MQQTTHNTAKGTGRGSGAPMVSAEEGQVIGFVLTLPLPAQQICLLQNSSAINPQPRSIFLQDLIHQIHT